MTAAKFAKRANTPGYALRARAWKTVQGLRQGLLRARALEEPVQGLRHGPLRALAPQGLVQGRTVSGALTKHIKKCTILFRAEFRWEVELGIADWRIWMLEREIFLQVVQ